jgi:hypothetical protein
MSLYTAGEIVVWLVLAAVLGGVLGWLLGLAQGRRLAASPSRDAAPARPTPTRSRYTRADDRPDPAAELREPTPPSTGGSTTATATTTDEKAATPRARRKDGALPGAFRGSVLPGPGGSSPTAEHQVKGNVDSMTYHLPGTPTHGRVTADVWFKDAETARAAGFRPPPSQV